MFNFFLVGSGVLGNAYALLLRDQLYWQAGVVAIIGVFVSLVSIGLDVRNEQLVDLGEAALRGVEDDYLMLDSGKPPEYAILRTEIFKGEPPMMLKHKGLVRSVETFVGIVFLGATFYLFFQCSVY